MLETSTDRSRAPRLELAWESRWDSLTGSLSALWRGPRPLRGLIGNRYFRDCSIPTPAPGRALAASGLWHVAFALLVVPLSQYVPAPPTSTMPRIELTWYGPINDLPMILPAAHAARPRPPNKAQEQEALPPLGADAFHPRQTILNDPMRPNHPRQTLIQPAAPPEPPQILPSLPNIVELGMPRQPEKPRIDEAILALKRPKAAAPVLPREIATPDLPNLELPPGPIDLSTSRAAKPALPIDPMSARRAPVNRTADVAAPEIFATNPESAQLIALSATPVPDRPAEIPQGNLSARLAISPEGTGAAAPGKQQESAPGGAGTGPAGLSISGGRAPASNASNLGGDLRIMPGTPGRPAAASPGVVPARAQPPSLLDRIQPGMAPEGLLGAKRIYTMHVTMPNLTSATGSWILSFAEMVPVSAESSGAAVSAGLSGPEPLRKVDPAYPPELRSGHVQGEVVLYAVIRTDGTVDSIQLVRGVDPRLDTNAMQALALWTFHPAERQGVPVEIEAVVRVPFRAVVPGY